MDLPSICSISLHHSDLLRLHNFPAQLYFDLRQTVDLSWSHGIQAERDFHSSKELKLKGNPWSDRSQSVETTLLALRIMEFMMMRGWNLLTATSLGVQIHTKDTWMFEYNGNRLTAAGSIKLSALSFIKKDRICVVDGSPLLARTVQATVQRRWPRGLQGVRSNSGMPEFELGGHPWHCNWKEAGDMVALLTDLASSGKENHDVHGFLIAILSDLEAQGFTFLASLRLTKTSSLGLPLDTWILISTGL